LVAKTRVGIVQSDSPPCTKRQFASEIFFVLRAANRANRPPRSRRARFPLAPG